MTECADVAGTNLLAGGSGASGSGSGSGGGYIDSGFLNTNSSTTYQFPDWDNDTQIIFFFASDPDGQGRYGIVPEATNYIGGATAGTYGTVGGSGSPRTSRVWRNATGLVSSMDSYSGNTAQGITLYRWSKSSGSASGSASGGGASVSTDETVPTNPSDGDLWYDESSAALYVYTDSIDGWIQANGGGGGGAGPRAYVSFDGTSATPTVYNSFNVSSITDRTTGDSANYGNQHMSQIINLTTPIVNPVVLFNVDNEAMSDGYAAIMNNYHIIDNSTIRVDIFNYTGAGSILDTYFNHWSVVIF